MMQTKTMWMIGGGVAAAVVGWYLWEQYASQASAATPALPASTATDASGTDTVSTDQAPDQNSGEFDASQMGSDYGDDNYANPYGLSPDLTQSPMFYPPPVRVMRPPASSSLKPKTYGQWYAGLSAAERAWVNRMSPAQRQQVYRTGYVIPFEHGQYGGPLHGLGARGHRRLRRRAYGGGGTAVASGGSDASDDGVSFVYDPDLD